MVIEPVGDLGDPFDLAVEGPLDAAILDVDIEGAHSSGLADRLGARGVPNIFVAGHDHLVRPRHFQPAPRLSGPSVARSMIDRVVAPVGRGLAS